MSKSRPILFSTPMVQAILAGRKTQTRRKIPGRVLDKCTMYEHQLIDAVRMCPYGNPGDTLWVRETHITGWPCELGELQQYDEDGNELPKHCWYKASPDANGGYVSNLGERICVWHDENENQLDRIPWKPSTHMPRWASRITLTITDVRVQRVQEITTADALAEGMTPTWNGESSPGVKCASEEDQFAELWDSINGAGSWERNDWVWAITFEWSKP